MFSIPFYRKVIATRVVGENTLGGRNHGRKIIEYTVRYRGGDIRYFEGYPGSDRVFEIRPEHRRD